MTHWWVTDLYQAGYVVELLSWIFWVILSITLHELAHGWVATWQGDPTPRQLGRMTANPVVHMGPTSLIIFALVGIAWGMMPTDPSRYRWRRRGRIVVAGAGPAMNLLLAVAAGGLLVLWLRVGPAGHRAFENLAVFLWMGTVLNVILAALNLLPVPPLDGSQILA
ncbi:MAG: site-2 protease family protein, partial [Planctomycetota bacterium]